MTKSYWSYVVFIFTLTFSSAKHNHFPIVCNAVVFLVRAVLYRGRCDAFLKCLLLVHRQDRQKEGALESDVICQRPHDEPSAKWEAESRSLEPHSSTTPSDHSES